MGDQDYNRDPVGGSNWWDSSRAAVSESGAGSVSSSRSSPLQPVGLGLSSQSQPLHQWSHPLFLGDKAGEEMGSSGGGGFQTLLQQGMAPFSAATGHLQKAAEPEFRPIKAGFTLNQQFHDTSSSPSSIYGNFQALVVASPQGEAGGGDYGYHHQPDYECLMGGGWTSNTNKAVDHHQFLKPNSMADPITSSKPAHSEYPGGGGTSFWNMDATPSSFFPPLSPLIQQHIPCFDQKAQHNVMEVRDTSGSGRKTSGSSSEKTTITMTSTSTSTSTGGTTNKRSRNEASSTSTLPPFKVRKEKMGDRITALQQLVSPFGKTDTASVLSEAIEYIKFLHEQVNVLSTPYLKSGASLPHHQTSEKSKGPEGPMQDLRSLGLCLVPVSSTFPVAHETTVDFWTPTFGGTFR